MNANVILDDIHYNSSRGRVGAFTTCKRPVRVLHVLGAMDRGGVETWLMHVLRNIDPNEVKMDFLVHTDRPCAYDEELEGLGSRIHFCPTPSNPLQYAINFNRILKSHGPYDVVHSHVHFFCGLVLTLSRFAGVPIRIAHSHNDTSRGDAQGSLLRKLYLRSCRQAIKWNGTARVAASAPAADALFGTAWRSDGKARVLYCGIDFSPFHQPVVSADVRREFGFTPDDFVIGHVGRFAEQKNHTFLLALYQAVLEIEPRAKLLLLGKGPLESSIRDSAERMGILSGIRFAGVRSDVARIMLGAMDVFVLPSLWEGLGLVAVEAQAAGLPTLLSTAVPSEADAGCGLVKFIDLQGDVEPWREQILSELRRSSRLQHTASQLQASHFSVDVSIRGLRELYHAC
jgi:glycosyltransferase involved in cell wall biosynthesis